MSKLKELVDNYKNEFETELHFTIDEIKFKFEFECAHAVENDYYDRPDGSSIPVGSRGITFGLQKHIVDNFAKQYLRDVETIEVKGVTVYYCEY